MKTPPCDLTTPSHDPAAISPAPLTTFLDPFSPKPSSLHFPSEGRQPHPGPDGYNGFERVSTPQSAALALCLSGSSPALLVLGRNTERARSARSARSVQAVEFSHRGPANLYFPNYSLAAPVSQNYTENGRTYHGFRRGVYMYPCDEVRFSPARSPPEFPSIRHAHTATSRPANTRICVARKGSHGHLPQNPRGRATRPVTQCSNLRKSTRSSTHTRSRLRDRDLGY